MEARQNAARCVSFRRGQHVHAGQGRMVALLCDGTRNNKTKTPPKDKDGDTEERGEEEGRLEQESRKKKRNKNPRGVE